jgi:hypothetical protein
MNEIKKSKPTETGLWLVRCMESDYRWYPVIIANSRNGLIVNFPHSGSMLLDAYHNSLAEIEWRQPDIYSEPDWSAA